MHARIPTHCIIYTSVVWLFLIVSVEFSIISLLRVHRSIMMALHVTPCLASQSPAVHIYLVCCTSMSEGSSRRCRSEAGQGSCSIGHRTGILQVVSAFLSTAVCRCMENEAGKTPSSAMAPRSGSALQSRAQGRKLNTLCQFN